MKAKPDIDGHKIYLHPDKVDQWKETGDCYPIHVEIGATARCNQKCVFCALDWVEHKTDIDTNVMLNALEDMARHEVRSVMFGGEGEPLLHKDIATFIQKSKEYGMDVALTTNGIYFDKEKREEILPYLSWVKFSVDAGNAEVYSKVHGTKEQDFNRLINNIRGSVDLKKERNLEATIGTQFLVLSQSMGSAEELTRELSQIKPDYLVLKPYSHHPLSNNDLAVDSEEYNQLRDTVTKYSGDNFNVLFREATMERIQEGNSYPECYGLPFISLIDSKGNILPCNLFYENNEFAYGNLYEKGFSEIWQGDKRKQVLQRLREKGVKDCREGCRCDAGNRYLHRIRNPAPHDNFT